jgi:hypothetical protein
MKKILFLSQMILLLFSYSAFCMKKELPPRPQVPAELSKEIVQFIMNSATLEDAIAAIKKYALIDPKIEESPSITQFLIKEIAHKWPEMNGDLIKTALFLNTKGAKNWLSSNDAKEWVKANEKLAETFLAEQAQLRQTGWSIKHPDELKTLLNLKVNPNAPSAVGFNTPLINAINEGNLDYVQLLLDAGANPNFIKGNGSPLYWAVQINEEIPKEKRLAIIKLLVNAGADPKLPVKTPFFGTVIPLDWVKKYIASHPENKEILKLLEQYKPAQPGKK